MSELRDHELLARFAALRAADIQATPDFETVLRRARRATRANTRFHVPWRLRIVLSVAAALLLAVGVARVSRRHDFVPQPLSTWTSPTAGLLRTPGTDLLASSALLPSVLDQLASTSSQRKGK